MPGGNKIPTLKKGEKPRKSIAERYLEATIEIIDDMFYYLSKLLKRHETEDLHDD